MEAMGNPERLAGSELKATLMPKLPSFKCQPKHDKVDRTSEANSLLKLSVTVPQLNNQSRLSMELSCTVEPA